MPGKIRVLHIIKSLGRGGAEMLLPETLKLHDQAQFEFHYIYFLPWKDQMAKAIADNGGKVSCFSSSNNLSIMMKKKAVRQYVIKHQIDIIHSHLPWAGILARTVGKSSGVPVVYTEHNKQERYHLATRIMNLFTMDMLQEVIAVSEDVAESIRRNKPGLRSPIRVIPNGVNIEHFDRTQSDRSGIRTSLNIPQDAPVIGTISVFRVQKRLELWLEVAAKILEARNDAHFIIVGDGPLRREIELRRDTLGLKERVHLPGIQTEVRPYLAAFDVFMMSSIFEGLPIAMLEAMAMRCPVISTDAGGIKELISHNEDGMLCPVDEWEKLSGYAIDLISDPARRLKLANQARSKVENKFSLKAMVKNLESLYKELTTP